MSLQNDERYTYTKLRVMDIKNKFKKLNGKIRESDEIEIINVALVLFSILCDAHTEPELERQDIIEDMLDTESDFIYYVNDLIQQTTATNEVLNEYIEKEISKRNQLLNFADIWK